jgi:hypothetical protein
VNIGKPLFVIIIKILSPLHRFHGVEAVIFLAALWNQAKSQCGLASFDAPRLPA